MQKSKAAKAHAALIELKAEFPQHQGMGRAIDEFLRRARPGSLSRLYDLVIQSETKEAALQTLAGQYDPR